MPSTVQPHEAPVATSSAKARAQSLTGAVLLIAATLVAYIPCLNGGFVWDDDAWTTDLNHLMQDVQGLREIWTNPTAMQQFYPMTGTTLWLDRQLWDLWTLPYHVENVLVHALSGVLLWRLLRRLQVPGAWLAGSVFALHPVMVESVAWITERKNVLSLFFMLGAMLAYGRFEHWWRTEPQPRPWGAYALALVLCLAALCSKITAFVFAPTVLLLCWWKRGTIRWRRDMLPTLPLFAMTFALGSLIWWLETHHVGAEGRDFSATFPERFITAGRSFWFYPWKLLWPTDLCFVYPDWRTTPLTSAHWMWPASALLAVAGLWLARRWTGRGPVVAILFYLGALSPVIGFLNAYGGLFSPVWDHWVYVPGLGIIALACAVIATVAGRAGTPWATRGFAIIALPVLASISWRQTGQYRDKETLWVETIKRNPACWLALNNHGSALASDGRLEEAVAHYEAALAARPDYSEALNNMGGALLKQGKPEAAADKYRAAIQHKPELAPFYRQNLGNALLVHGRTEEAVDQFLQSLAVMPDHDEALNSLGAALVKLGRVDEAIGHLRRAIEIKPGYHQAHNNLGSALQKKGDVDGAIGQYRKAAELRPDFVEAHYNLGEMLYRKGDLDAAIACYQKVTALQPDHAEAHYNLGLCYTNQEKIPEADSAYERAIQIRPDYASAHNNLGNNLLKMGRPGDAIPHFKKAIEADAQQLAALNNLAWVLATDMNATLRDGTVAMEMARRALALGGEQQPILLVTLSAACAETGRFPEAAQHARRALEVASAQGNASLASSIEGYLKLYEAGQPVRIQRGG